jgi:hypothetical protein
MHGSRRIAATSLAAAGLLLGLAVTFSTPASAQQPPAKQPTAQKPTINPEQACRDDAFKLCNDFIPDRDKVGACLRRKARSLSKDCRTVVFSGGPRGAKHKTARHHRKTT